MTTNNKQPEKAEGKKPADEKTKKEDKKEATKYTLPKIKPGMTVKVHQKIKEKGPKGEKERIQVFEGIIDVGSPTATTPDVFLLRIAGTDVDTDDLTGKFQICGVAGMEPIIVVVKHVGYNTLL